MGRARHDANLIPTVTAVSYVDGETPVELYADPVTHSLISASTPTLKTILDDYTTTSVTYIGKATTGTATASATWQIQKIDETTGMIITWADGDSSFNNIWDNRASLTYA